MAKVIERQDDGTLVVVDTPSGEITIRACDIESIDRPPFPFRRTIGGSFVFGEQATRIVTTNGVIWTKGDRKWWHDYLLEQHAMLVDAQVNLEKQMHRITGLIQEQR